jgi:hypothetical protein
MKTFILIIISISISLLSHAHLDCALSVNAATIVNARMGNEQSHFIPIDVSRFDSHFVELHYASAWTQRDFLLCQTLSHSPKNVVKRCERSSILCNKSLAKNNSSIKNQLLGRSDECRMSLFQNDPVRLKGNVISKENNEPVIGATVVLKSNRMMGDQTDLNGNFVLKINEIGSLHFPDTLRITCIGYEVLNIPIQSIQELKGLFVESSSYYLTESKEKLTEEYGPPTGTRKASHQSIEIVTPRQIKTGERRKRRGK